MSRSQHSPDQPLVPRSPGAMPSTGRCSCPIAGTEILNARAQKQRVKSKELRVPPLLLHTQRDQRAAGFPLAPPGTMSVRLSLSKSSPDSSPVSQGSRAPPGTAGTLRDALVCGQPRHSPSAPASVCHRSRPCVGGNTPRPPTSLLV